MRIHVVAAVGILMCMAGLATLAAPAWAGTTASWVVKSARLRGAAIALRIVFGAIVIVVSDQTPYPWPMKIIGVAAIMAGTIVAMIDKETLAGWAAKMREGGAASRVMAACSLALGAFLVHASWSSVRAG